MLFRAVIPVGKYVRTTRMQVQRAPAGGATIGGQKFKGGQFIPKEVLEKATAEEKSQIEGKGSTEQTRTPEFKNWFGSSKVVDENGRPQVTYHGTNEDFSEFLKEKIGSSTDPGQLGHGFYFSTDNNVIGDQDKAGLATFLSIKKPLQLRYERWGESKEDKIRAALGLSSKATAKEVTEQAIKQGFDGVALDYSAVGYNHTEWVAFEPTQIKSATGNKGSFDPHNPNIRMSGG